MTDDAIKLAREVMNQPYSHPYSTMYVLARDFLAAHEENERLRKPQVYLPMDCPICGRSRVEWNGTELKCEKCTTSSEWDGFSTERYQENLRSALKEALDIAKSRLTEAMSCDAFHPPGDAEFARIAELDKLLQRP